MDYLVWCFILTSWLSYSGGFEFCIQDDNPLRCGIPPLTEDQIQNIDQVRLREIQQLLIQRNGIPLTLEDTSIPIQLRQPLVELTPNQQAALDRKYGSSSGVGTAGRRKRGTSGEACPATGSHTVLFALTVGDDVCQINAFGISHIQCDQNGACCERCCMDDICVPLTCVNLNNRVIGHFDVMLKRCTCCNMLPGR